MPLPRVQRDDWIGPSSDPMITIMDLSQMKKETVMI